MLTPLGAEAQPEEEPEESDEPVELAYVSLAAYFPREAQRDAMIAASYAPFRSRVYVVGNDVQRQEMLANGEFSAWQDVTNSKATPRLDILRCTSTRKQAISTTIRKSTRPTRL